jgi:hypothetical protein
MEKKYDRRLGSKRSQGIVTPKAPQNRSDKPIRALMNVRIKHGIDMISLAKKMGLNI